MLSVDLILFKLPGATGPGALVPNARAGVQLPKELTFTLLQIVDNYVVALSLLSETYDFGLEVFDQLPWLLLLQSADLMFHAPEYFIVFLGLSWNYVDLDPELLVHPVDLHSGFSELLF